MQKNLYNHNNFNLKKMMYIVITSVIMLCLACVTVNAAGVKPFPSLSDVDLK